MIIVVVWIVPWKSPSSCTALRCQGAVCFHI